MDKLFIGISPLEYVNDVYSEKDMQMWFFFLVFGSKLEY